MEYEDFHMHFGVVEDVQVNGDLHMHGGVIERLVVKGDCQQFGGIVERRVIMAGGAAVVQQHKDQPKVIYRDRVVYRDKIVYRDKPSSDPKIRAAKQEPASTADTRLPRHQVRRHHPRRATRRRG